MLESPQGVSNLHAKLSSINGLLEDGVKPVQAACSIKNGQEESVDRLICTL